MQRIWQVKKVDTYPKCWKVYPTKLYQEKNDSWYYFRIQEEALQDAYWRNKFELEKILTAEPNY